MFDAALQKLGMTTTQVFMIGDSMEKDILGAANLGIEAWHVKTGRLFLFK